MYYSWQSIFSCLQDVLQESHSVIYYKTILNIIFFPLGVLYNYAVKKIIRD